jgi:hypothetical protein
MPQIPAAMKKPQARAAYTIADRFSSAFLLTIRLKIERMQQTKERDARTIIKMIMMLISGKIFKPAISATIEIWGSPSVTVTEGADFLTAIL